TKTPRRFMRKVLSYASRRFRSIELGSTSNMTVLVVGDDPRWLERYRAGVAHLRLPIGIWFATLSDVTANPLGPIWQPAMGYTKRSLRHLQNPSVQYGNDTAENGRSFERIDA